MARRREDREARRTQNRAAGQESQQYYQQTEQQYYSQGDPRMYQQPQGDPRMYQQAQGDPRMYQQAQGYQQGYYQQPQGDPRMYQQAQGYQQGYYQQPQGGPPTEREMAARKKRKRRRTRKIVLFVVEVLILLILAAGLYVAAQISRISEIQTIDVEQEEQITQQIKAQLPDEVEETLQGYWNIALYGVDSRYGTTDGLSDAIMIASINRDTKEVKVVSVYRDTYLDNTNGDYRKATECYILGGPSRSINMLNKNLDMDITNYITVNMNVLADVVEAVGGVEIDVKEDEVTWINNYQNETSQITGRQIVPVTSAGYQTLNGIQATSYCRIRYVGNADYERTERQRRVLSVILQKVQANPLLLTQMVDAMIANVDTNLTKMELLDLAKNIASYHLGETVGFPFDLQSISMGNDIVVPVNLANNVSQLHQFLFGVEGYTPSPTVQEISNIIANNTGVY